MLYRSLSFVFIFLASVLIGNRTDGPDLDGYLDYYTNTTTLVTNLIFEGEFHLDRLKLIIELFFSILTFFITPFTSFSGYIFSIAIVQALLLTYIIFNYKDGGLFIISYFLLFFFFLHSWYLRQGFSILFFVLFIIYSKKNNSKGALSSLLLSIFSHISSLLIFILIFTSKKFSNKTLAIVILVGIVLYALEIDLFSYVASFIPFYGDYLNFEGGFSKLGYIQMTSLPLLLFILLYGRNTVNARANFGVALLFSCLSLTLFMHSIPLIGRYNSFFYPLSLIILFSEVRDYFSAQSLYFYLIRAVLVLQLMLLSIRLWLFDEYVIEMFKTVIFSIDFE
jgi:hypothetical protein